ncbi:AAA family ATPase [Allonocardiopsis opalescens]|uniref:Broad-specificity NMP kinase n=1 Tax=Allonocardiopsis opalescens TaxID=1144618 RepID=A0A2T0PX54_9ACTN|nr:AAA family ATPase [Allonocardiopsis opalescens]PRX96112.1 broad-specificity NMP kinase [Allonocardiopsis opalescens]
MNLLICAACGVRNDEPVVVPDAPVLACPHCGHRQPFLRLPLLCVTGPSGTGKSTVAALLLERLRDRCVVLEQDLLWVDGLRDPADDYRAFRGTWLRLAAMVHQSGRPAVLCGTVMPPEFERLPERVLFDRIHYLALVSEPEVLAARLRARPAWREWNEERIAETVDFNEWVRGGAATMDPPVALLDTTTAPPEHTADAVAEWVAKTLG